METLDEIDPWEEEPCFIAKLLHDPGSRASFFKPDVWHTVNLGVGRSWISNSIVMMIGSLDELNAMSQEDALSYLSADYISFCESSESWLCICFPIGEFFLQLFKYALFLCRFCADCSSFQKVNCSKREI